MKRKILPAVISSIAVLTLAEGALATEIKVSGDLELYYERSSDIKSADNNDDGDFNDAGDTQDDDQFKTQQLYLTIDGKFDGDTAARLKLDSADIVNGDGKDVNEKIVEEANFTLKNIGGSPVTLVFGKDEMPFGLDYDKHLTDPLQHNFEIDKVWGAHFITKLNDQHKFAVALYENRNGSEENELTSNYTARYNGKNIVKGLDIEVSVSQEQYETNAEPGDEDEKRTNVGAVYRCNNDMSSANFEYTAIKNIKGDGTRDPSLITLGVEHKLDNKHAVWGRVEVADADEATGQDVEENFYTIGYTYAAAKKYTLSAEYSNYNSSDYSEAKDLFVPDNNSYSMESSIKLGVRAKF